MILPKRGPKHNISESGAILRYNFSMDDATTTKNALTPRLFIGIPLSDEAKKKLKVQSWPGLSRYKKEKMTPQYNWHITLAFLGNIPIEKYEPLLKILKNWKLPESFKTSVRHFGAFPEMDNARVLWAGLEKNRDEIEKLGKRLRELLDKKKIPYDEKPFIPHITMCRLKCPKNLSRLSEDGKMKQEINFEINEIHLYKSIGGSHPYEILETIELS